MLHAIVEIDNVILLPIIRRDQAVQQMQDHFMLLIGKRDHGNMFHLIAADRTMRSVAVVVVVAVAGRIVVVWICGGSVRVVHVLLVAVVSAIHAVIAVMTACLLRDIVHPRH